ncbi:MAG: glycosyl hydrolase family 28-related protein [Planctomycetota bacterium]|nr:glycosyl hydrolase family 28-related protein [Planctomycetota bacterium]
MKFLLGTTLTLCATVVAVISDVDSTQPATSPGATNVATYGAIPDDGKDDTAAIQRALAACAGSPQRTLSFPGGRYHLSSLTFRKDVSIQLANGTLLELERGGLLRINGPFRAGLYQVFSGPGDVHFGAGSVSEIYPQWWGASPASSDSSPAINRAINSAPDLPGINIRLSGLFHCQSTIHVNRHRVKLIGDGMYATQLTFNPTTPKTLFEFSHADKSVLAQCSIRDMGLLGAGNYEDRDRVQKVGIKIVDADILEVRNIAIHNWGGNQSIGLQVQGRELVFVENITILADLPILIDKNPGLDWISIDHSTFRNTYLLPMDPHGPSVQIASGVALHNVVFDGTNAWVGGKYGLYWEDTETKGVSINLSVKNVRMENGTAHGGAMIHIAHNYNLMNLVLENIYGCGGGVGGIYLRKCTGATLQNIFYTPVRGNAPAGYIPTALDIDDSSTNLVLINAFWNGGLIKTGKLVKTFGTNSNPSRYDNRLIETYDRPDNGQGEGLVLYGTKTWCYDGVLANGASLPLPVGANDKTRVATITVAASGQGQADAAAQFMLGREGRVLQVSGTRLTSNSSEVGHLCLISGPEVLLQNRLGTEVDVVVTVFWR